MAKDTQELLSLLNEQETSGFDSDSGEIRNLFEDVIKEDEDEEDGEQEPDFDIEDMDDEDDSESDVEDMDMEDIDIDSDDEMSSDDEEISTDDSDMGDDIDVDMDTEMGDVEFGDAEPEETVDLSNASLEQVMQAIENLDDDESYTIEKKPSYDLKVDGGGEDAFGGLGMDSEGTDEDIEKLGESYEINEDDEYWGPENDEFIDNNSYNDDEYSEYSSNVQDERIQSRTKFKVENEGVTFTVIAPGGYYYEQTGKALKANRNLSVSFDITIIVDGVKDEYPITISGGDLGRKDNYIPSAVTQNLNMQTLGHGIEELGKNPTVIFPEGSVLFRQVDNNDFDIKNESNDYKGLKKAITKLKTENRKIKSLSKKVILKNKEYKKELSKNNGLLGEAVKRLKEFKNGSMKQALINENLKNCLKLMIESGTSTRQNEMFTTYYEKFNKDATTIRESKLMFNLLKDDIAKQKESIVEEGKHADEVKRINEWKQGKKTTLVEKRTKIASTKPQGHIHNLMEDMSTRTKNSNK